MPNRLAQETSPYLRQHADNPVDWYPWGEEAMARARAEDKPILLSVGYSACHSCHVMAHESFEDDETARLMNERFVNVKVDREEMPDVDQIYQQALQLQGEHGGWPLTMFLTPAGVPFFGGTYFPTRDSYGRPSFKRLCLALSDAWQSTLVVTGFTATVVVTHRIIYLLSGQAKLATLFALLCALIYRFFFIGTSIEVYPFALFFEIDPNASNDGRRDARRPIRSNPHSDRRRGGGPRRSWFFAAYESAIPNRSRELSR